MAFKAPVVSLPLNKLLKCPLRPKTFLDPNVSSIKPTKHADITANWIKNVSSVQQPANKTYMIYHNMKYNENTIPVPCGIISFL